MSFGKQFVHAMCKDGDVADLLAFGQIDHLFKDNEVAAYAYLREHVKKFHVVPDLDTLEAHVGEELLPSKEPPAYYIDLLKKRFVERELKSMFKKAQDLLVVGKDPEKALELVMATGMELVTKEYQHLVTDFRHAYDLIIGDYTTKWSAPEEYGLKFGWPTLDEMAGGLVRGDLISIVGRPAMGKATTLTTPILMADGTVKLMASIAVGDVVASVDGAPSQVTGVFPQGKREVYRVTLSDGRTSTVDGDHLWTVGSKRWSEYRVMTTREIAVSKHRLFLPPFAGIYGAREPFMDPYLLGALIGDGCMSGNELTFTTADPAILHRARKGLPSGHGFLETKSQNAGEATTYALVTLAEDNRRPRNTVKAALRQVGLYGCKSESKFLPGEVYAWPREHRLALLQGLMDTDGTAGVNQAVFGSSSLRLVEDVARLTWSLGGTVGWFSPKKTTHRDHYRISVILPDAPETFSLDRKSERMSPKDVRVYIDLVEAAGVEACQCISVSHPSELFLIEDFVVTHNTWQMLYAAMHGWLASNLAIAKGKDVPTQSRLFVSMEMKPLPIQQRLASMLSHLAIKDIDTANLNTKYLNKLKKDLLAIQGFAAPFYVVDGNLTATVEDIWALARQLDVDGIFIDGGYLLKHPRERDRFKRVAENAELIKSDLCDLAPTAVSWQFSRTGSKKQLKKGETPGLDDIGYTDAIAQVSSLALGLSQDDSVETMIRRRVDILKGRKGETGSFLTNWKFSGPGAMDFSEVLNVAVEDLQFI